LVLEINIVNYAQKNIATDDNSNIKRHMLLYSLLLYCNIIVT